MCWGAAEGRGGREAGSGGRKTGGSDGGGIKAAAVVGDDNDTGKLGLKRPAVMLLNTSEAPLPNSMMAASNAAGGGGAAPPFPNSGVSQTVPGRPGSGRDTS